MAGWAPVPRDAVLIADPRLARDLAKAIDAFRVVLRADGLRVGAELEAVQVAFVALSGGVPLMPATSQVSQVSSRVSSGFGVRRSGVRTVSVAEAAVLLGKSEVWVRRLCGSEQLAAWRDGRRWLIEEESVMKRVAA